MDKVKDLQRRVKELEAQLAHARQQRDQTTSELAL
jgi:BMFP domain-containing protein YqiC